MRPGIGIFIKGGKSAFGVTAQIISPMALRIAVTVVMVSGLIKATEVKADYYWLYQYFDTGLFSPTQYPTYAAACDAGLKDIASKENSFYSHPPLYNYVTTVRGGDNCTEGFDRSDRYLCCAQTIYQMPSRPDLPAFLTQEIGYEVYLNTGVNTCTLPKTLIQATRSCGLPTDNPKNPPGLPCLSTPNPISITSGNKYLDETDYAPSGLSPLRFTRHYNSLPGYYYQNRFGTAGITSNPMGPFWYHNYNQGLKVSTGQVTLTRAGGQTFTYNSVGGGWQTDADVNYRLTEVLNGSNVRTGWAVTTPDDSVETYSAIGDLLAITGRSGLSQTLTYSDTTTPTAIAAFPGMPIKVSDNFGRNLSFVYNTTGQLASMTDPAGNVTKYSYDTNGNLNVVTFPDGSQKAYVYGETGNVSATPNAGVDYSHSLTGAIDENGVRYATYQYDATGKAILEYTNGNTGQYGLAITYNNDGSTSTAVTDPLGSVRTTHFSTVLGVVKATGTDQPGGSGCGAASSAITYDANGNVASKTDFNGHMATYSYDLSRNLETSRTEGLAASGAATPETRTVTTTWDARFRLPATVTEPGRVTAYAYDGHANTTQKVITDTVTGKSRAWNTAYTYDGNGILLQKAEDGPRTDVADTTTYDYYPANAACPDGSFGCRGQLKQVTTALGHATKFTGYNANGQPTSATDPNGLTITMAYDARRRPTSMAVGTEQATYAYDPAGQLAKATQPNGAYLAYTYDNAHRLIKVKDQLGNTRTYTLDNMGNRVKEDLADPNGQLARSQAKVYDALARLQNLVSPQ